MLKFKSIYVFVLSLILWQSAFAQQLEVTSLIKSTTDLTAATNLRTDLNGKACGLIKVQAPVQGLSFEGNIVGDVDFKGGEYWVYVSDNSKQIVLKHNNANPTPVEFGRFGIPTIEAKSTYVLKVNAPSNIVAQTADVTFKIYPSSAILTIDNVEYETQNGRAHINLSCGEHTYLAVAPGYKTQSNVFRVTKDGNNKIVIELDSKDDNYATEPVSTQPFRPSYSANSGGNVIGYYDQNKVFTSIPDIVKAQKQLQDASGKYEQEFQVLTSQVQSKYEEYQKLGSDAPEAIKERRIQEIQELSNRVDAFRTAAEKDLQVLQNQLMKPWTDKFDTALNVIKSNKGLVSTQDANTTRLNGIQYVDITDDIINMLLGKTTGSSTVMIGVYDTDKVFTQHPTIVAAQNELSELSKRYESEYGKLQGGFNNAYNNFQVALKDEPNMPEAIKERRIQEIQEWQKKLEDYQKTATDDLQKRQTELTKPLQDKIQTALSVISDQRGLASTQDKDAARLSGNVKYIDITDEVVQMIK